MCFSLTRQPLTGSCQHLQVQAQDSELKKRKRPKAAVGPGKLAKKGKSSKGLDLVGKWAAVRKDLVGFAPCRVRMLALSSHLL